MNKTNLTAEVLDIDELPIEELEEIEEILNPEISQSRKDGLVSDFVDYVADKALAVINNNVEGIELIMYKFLSVNVIIVKDKNINNNYISLYSRDKDVSIYYNRYYIKVEALEEFLRDARICIEEDL